MHMHKRRLAQRKALGGACRVGYLDREGNLLAATVVGVDRTITPHSYAVEIHALGVVRETEAHRLRPAALAEQVGGRAGRRELCCPGHSCLLSRVSSCLGTGLVGARTCAAL